MLKEELGRYHELVFYVLRRLRLCEEGELSYSPHVHWEEKEGLFSVVLLAPFREGASEFFHSIVCQWLVPGRRLVQHGFFSASCVVPEWGEQLGIVAELILQLSIEDVESARNNLALLTEEICLGVFSAYHARRIIEAKVLSVDEKRELVQEGIAQLVRVRPLHFDMDVLEEMQHFFVAASPSFCATRYVRHVVRVVSCFYLFRRFLEKKTEEVPGRRHVSLKLLRVRLSWALGDKRALGLCIGISGLTAQERFDVEHVMQAIGRALSSVEVVKNSFVSVSIQEGSMRLIYLEVERGGGGGISAEDMCRLRAVLPQHLRESVERLARPLFMPRNEEEVMRCIVTLSQQLKFAKDLPQVVIIFDRQWEEDLIFTVILVRVARVDDGSLQQLTLRGDIVLDRVKQVGLIRNRHRKQALVFRLKMPLAEFVRSDHVVDLYKARKQVLVRVQDVFGEVRDYNGGMIARQSEIFARMQTQLGDLSDRQSLLLETFFHAIFPAEWRSIAAPDALCALFRHMLNLAEGSDINRIVDRGPEALYVAMRRADTVSLEQAVERMQLTSFHLLKVRFDLGEEVCLGYILFCHEKQEDFLSVLDFSC